jgi:hypothetical protein
MTTTSPAAWEPLETALRQRRPIHVTYHGRQRLVCPHALGWNNTRPLLLAYQIGGDTSTGTLPADPRNRWRCLFIDEINDVTTAEPASKWGSADNYNPGRPFNNNTEITVAIPANDRPTGR